MAFIRQIPDDEAEGVLKRVYTAAIARAGAVAGIIRVMSLDGHAVQGSMGFYISIMKRQSALSPSRREMLATVTSCVNDCYY